MYKLILFDLDGTILNTLNDLANAVNYALEKNNLPKRTIEEVREFIGNGIKNLCHKSSNGICEEEVFTAFKEYYSLHNHDESYVYKNIPTLLLRLKERYMLGILSNKKDNAVKVLNDYYFPNIFDFAYGERDNVARKPDPEAIELLKKEYSLDNSDILYIGDSDVDITFSKNAKIDYIICSWGFRDRDYLEKLNPMRIVDDPLEILELL